MGTGTNHIGPSPTHQGRPVIDNSRQGRVSETLRQGVVVPGAVMVSRRRDFGSGTRVSQGVSTEAFSAEKVI